MYDLELDFYAFMKKNVTFFSYMQYLKKVCIASWYFKTSF